MTEPFNDTFLRACRGEEVSHIPVWYMRQAGRYQPEYREIRKKHTFFEMSENPDVCTEVTRLPVDQLGVDAAILFADIMTPIKAAGVPVDIVPGKGPEIDPPIRTLEDIKAIKKISFSKDLPFIGETISRLAADLNVPLIGFSGAPFTLASYMIEGGPSKNYHKTKGFMYSKPVEWQALMDTLADMVVGYLKGQIAAGAKAVQVFDSWVGALTADDYEAHLFPTMEKIFGALKDEGVPVIYFGSGTSHLYQLWSRLPVDVVSVDYRISIDEARILLKNKAVQGNMDPSLLLAPETMMLDKAKAILDAGSGKPGFIFNLGHGIFPEARVESLQKLTSFIHEYSKQLIGSEK